MKTLFASLLYFFLITGINAQTVKFEVKGEVINATLLDEQPQYPEGSDAFKSYVASSLKYMKKAKGKIHVSFGIEEDGSVKDVMVLKGIHPEVDKKVMDVIEKSKKWIPGHKGNLPVKSRVAMAIDLKPN